MKKRTALADPDDALDVLIAAARAWRINVVIGGQSKYSRALAAAVDAYNATIPEDHQ